MHLFVGNDGRDQNGAGAQVFRVVEKLLQRHRGAEIVAEKTILLDAAVLDVENFMQTNRMFILTNGCSDDVDMARSYPGLDLIFRQWCLSFYQGQIANVDSDFEHTPRKYLSASCIDIS